MKKKSGKYANLVKNISEFMSADEGAKCGYDLWMGYHKGDLEARYGAWMRYLDERRNNKGHSDVIRDGIWVPAIEYRQTPNTNKWYVFAFIVLGSMGIYILYITWLSIH